MRIFISSFYFIDFYYKIDLHEHSKQIKNIQFVIHNEVAKNIKISQSQQKKNYEKHHKNPCHFKVGDEVLVYNLRRANRKGDKGKYIWDGPYEVIRTFDNKGLYELKICNGDTLHTKHHGSSMKLFKKKTNNMKKYDEVSDDKCANFESVKIVKVLVNQTNSLVLIENGVQVLLVKDPSSFQNTFKKSYI